jgi:methionine-gamma-lyase
MLHKFGVEVTLIDFNDLELIKKSLKSNTVMVYFETPCNPTIKVNDIKAIATIAHNYNKHIKVVLDGTFASPYLQHPLQLGVDIVIHSMTKYINGHSDVLGGCVCGSKKDLKMIRDEGLRDSTGAVLSPDDAYLVLRGLKTLGVRMKTICENALSIAKYLEKSPYVKKVYYPGLKSHKNHTIAKKQMESFGGMISFETNLNFNQTKKFVNNLQMVTLAVSLGGVESLIEHPTSMTHVLFTKEALVKSGITPNLIRFSTGIEDVKDLINDFEQAFKNSKK